MVLGLDAARGFAPADQTSPALAAAADALVDTTTFIEPGLELFSEPVTELRIRLLGTPEPSGDQFVRPPSGALSDALAVPWPTYAFGAAPLGLAGGGIVAGIVLGIRFRHRVKAAAIPGPGFSPVHKVYAASTALAPGFKADADETRRPRPSTATPSGGRTRARTS